MRNLKSCLTLLLFFVFLSGYTRPPPLKESIWNDLKPYFLPAGHPAKNSLDAIFQSKKRVLQDSKTLIDAGFTNGEPEKRSHIIVTTHPKVPGFIFKIYLDKQPYHHGKPEWDIFLHRIQGVNAILKYIENSHKGSLFKAPKKWLYPIPNRPKASKYSDSLKNFILVEELMDLVGKEENLRKWRSKERVSISLLNEIYPLLKTVQFGDGIRPDNLPFCRDGKIAFIDTYKVGQGRVRYELLTKFLPSELQTYWKDLYENHP